MKSHLNFLLILLTFLLPVSLMAETWNEPWQKEIIKKADYFVLAKVLSNVDTVGAEIEIIKSFGEDKLNGTLLISGFSLLHMTSSSGHGLHLNFEEDQVFYFFLTKRKDGNYAIPTPTSGFAFVDEDQNVHATYRHSYHKALIPQDVYEKTYTEIWNYFKEGEFEEEKILPLINKFIDKEPAGFDENEISTFFLQHVAMETAYLLDVSIQLDRLKKFIESDNYHSKVSALQLLSNLKDEETKVYLFDYIKNEENDNFEKVIAIWSLSKIGGRKYKKKLLSIEDSQSDEETGFGGNIMDPRVGTYFPSPKRAIQNLK